MTESTEKYIKKDVARRLYRLQTMPEHPQKAALANLRRGLGYAPGDLPALWGLILQDLPEELESKTGIPTPAEWSIYLAMTLYALHQQGRPLPGDNMHKPGVSLGQAVRGLEKKRKEPEDSDLEGKPPQKNDKEDKATQISPILRRFNALATSASMAERVQHLRGIVQLLRAEGIPLDYVQLAEDLYWLQFPARAPRVRLRWGQDYYCAVPKEENSPDKP